MKRVMTSHQRWWHEDDITILSKFHKSIIEHDWYVLWYSRCLVDWLTSGWWLGLMFFFHSGFKRIFCVQFERIGMLCMFWAINHSVYWLILRNTSDTSDTIFLLFLIVLFFFIHACVLELEWTPCSYCIEIPQRHFFFGFISLMSFFLWIFEEVLKSEEDKRKTHTVDAGKIQLLDVTFPISNPVCDSDYSTPCQESLLGFQLVICFAIPISSNPLSRFRLVIPCRDSNR